MGSIIYHKYISIVLISDIKEEFLLFTIGAEGDWGNEKKQGQEKEEYVLKYNVSIPDMISIKCVEDKTLDECKQKSLKTQNFQIYNQSVNLKIIFILLLIVILGYKSAEKKVSSIVEEECNEGVRCRIINNTNIHFFTWDTGYYYGVNFMKEIKYKFPSRYRECDGKCNRKNYNCWHFADLIYTIFTKSKYEIKIDSVGNLENTLTSWSSLGTLRKEQCCIRNLITAKGIKYKNDFIEHLRRILRLAGYHELVNNVGIKQETVQSEGGNLKKIKWKKSKKIKRRKSNKIKRRKNKSKRKPRKINKKQNR